MIAWIALASAQDPAPAAIAEVETAWNAAWRARDLPALEERMSPEYGTIRTTAKELVEVLDQLGDDEDGWKELAAIHATPDCKLAAMVTLDPLEVEGLFRCEKGFWRVRYDRADEGSPWRRANVTNARRELTLYPELAGPTRYTWHQVDVDAGGWAHYRSGGAAGVLLSVRKTRGPCPAAIAMAAKMSDRRSAGLSVQLSEDLAVRSTRESCLVFVRSSEEADQPCTACRQEERIRLLQLAERLRYVQPGVASELVKGAIRREPKPYDALWEIAALGEKEDDAVVPTGSEIVAKDGRVALVEPGPVTVVDFEVPVPLPLVRGTADVPVVWGAEDLGQGRFALTVPVDVVASAVERWIASNKIPEVRLKELDGGTLQFRQRKEPVVEVRPYAQGSLIRFAPLGPLPAPPRKDMMRAILAQSPPTKQVFVLPAGSTAEPLWACPRNDGCATGAMLFEGGLRVAIPDGWMASLEKCWRSARPVDELMLPESTLKVKSRLGPVVIDLAGDTARTEGRVYTAECLLDEGRRLQTWMRMHRASRSEEAGELDAWGNGLKREGSTWTSFGADGKAGGDGLGKDFSYPE